MIATWMLSSVVFTTLLGIAALCAEWGLRNARRATRWPWLLAVAVGTIWPLIVPVARRFLTSDITPRTVSAVLPTIQVVPDRLPILMLLGTWLDTGLLASWALASAIILTRLVAALVVIARLRRASEVRLIDDVPVLVTGTIGPAVIGAWRPRVLLPAALLDLDIPLRRLVLRHELEHCRANDQLAVLGSALALALVPWNLPLWWISRRCRLALEVDCDARVLADESNARLYGKLLVLISQRQRVTVLAPMLAASSSHLERRIAAMLPVKMNGRGARVALALGATIVAGIAACTSRISDGVAGPKPLVAARSATADTNQPYFEFQATKLARQIPGTGNMRYPALLRAANVEGEVLAQFVVDRDGIVEPGTFKVLKSNHDLFTQAVKAALPDMRFHPAEVKGVRVKQLVQQPFTFGLSRNEAARTPATGPVNADQPYFEFQVERPAQQTPGTGNLRYPAELRQADVEGEVLAQFIVGADGRYVDKSFRELKSNHQLFTDAVKTALPTMRFTPAMVGGKAVTQLVQQPFWFTLSKN
ncbi:hypothetical protein BH11GEM1_BH11GEM1_06970 [soil metagenome]